MKLKDKSVDDQLITYYANYAVSSHNFIELSKHKKLYLLSF